MQKKIRIKDIAEKAGVSTGTVDRILHNRGNVSKNAREKVEKVLKESDYTPNIHLSGLSLKKIYRIAITTPSTAPENYWESIHRGIRKAIQQYKSIKIEPVVFTYDQYDANSCRDIFSQVSAVKPDAVIIGPTFVDETIALTKQLEEDNIRYVYVDSMIDGTNPLAFFTTDQFTSGYLMCKLLNILLPDLSDIGIMQAIRIGNRSANNTVKRREGVDRFLQDNRLKNNVFGIKFHPNQPDANNESMSEFFSKHPDTKGIIVLNSHGNIMADFLKRNRKSDVKLVCMDLTGPNIAALKDGSIEFLINQNPEQQGYMAMKTLLEQLVLKMNGKVENYLPMEIITKETIDLHLQYDFLHQL